MTSSKFGYCAEADYSSTHISFDEATRNDIPEIAELYRKIAITKQNYNEKFDMKSPNSFSRTGGMYIIHTEETLNEIFDEGKSFIAVARENGKIVGSFWVCEYDPHFVDFLPTESMFKDKKDYDSLLVAIRNKSIIYPRELIIDKDCTARKVSLLLFYTIFKCMHKRGYTHSLGEVYRLHSVIRDDKEIVLNMLNDRSFNMTSSTGGFYLGTSPLFNAECDGFTAVIEAQIFDFDYDFMLPKLSRLFSDEGINVTFPEIPTK